MGQKKERLNNLCCYCGTQHKKGKEQCPAYGKTCKLCKQDNYSARYCKTKNIVNACGVNEEVFAHDEDEYAFHADEVSPSSLLAKMCVNGKLILFQLDIGAATSCMSERFTQVCQKTDSSQD